MKLYGGGEWIRTTESSANGFTVRPLWPTRELLQNGGPSGTRTRDTLIKSQVLYRLS